MAFLRGLEAFVARGAGSDAEAQAAEYLRSQLAGMGLDARIEEFPLPDGRTSRNVVARIQGTSSRVLVLGAHFDTKPPSPGANDNASGCGALLEIASILARQPVAPTVELVFFGSEETNGGDPNGHHFGSRYRVAQMTPSERAATAGMISVDMIGYGSGFHSRTMGRGPLTLSDMVLDRAQALGIGMTYLRDPGSSGWSDHEAYELAGIPVSWIEWRDDPVYHTAGDVASHLQPARIQTAGRLVLDFVRSLDEAELSALTGR
jgi:Zn-dependent M28 family amino/carboxypeptidase